jgi:hypothetical protein
MICLPYWGLSLPDDEIVKRRLSGYFPTIFAPSVSGYAPSVSDPNT